MRLLIALFALLLSFALPLHATLPTSEDCVACEGTGTLRDDCPTCAGVGRLVCTHCASFEWTLFQEVLAEEETWRTLDEIAAQDDESLRSLRRTGLQAASLAKGLLLRESGRGRGTGKPGELRCHVPVAHRGRASCDVCRGKETLKCGWCRRGTHKCSSCAGKKVLELPCDPCGGTGHLPPLPESDTACPLCSSTQSIPCTHCGDGLLRDVPCSTCHASGKTVCTDCIGSGTVFCSTCLSTGQELTAGLLRQTTGKPCPTCAGEGTWDCGRCSAKGLVACGTCEGEKKVASAPCYLCEGTASRPCGGCARGSGRAWLWAGQRVQARDPQRARRLFHMGLRRESERALFLGALPDFEDPGKDLEQQVKALRQEGMQSQKALERALKSVDDA